MSRAVGRPPELPSEHGAWVMLALPILFGLRVAGAGSPGAWLVAAAALLVLLAEDAIGTPARRAIAGKPVPRPKLLGGLAWGSAYLATSVALFASAVLRAPDATRAPLALSAGGAAFAGALFGYGSLTGRRKSAPFELFGMAGFAATAPLMGLAGGVTDRAGLVASGVLALGYSASSLAYVRAFRSRTALGGRGAALCVAAHVAIAVVTFALLEIFSADRRLSLVLAPAFARTAWGLVRPPATLRRLGLTELAVAATVAVLGSALLG